MKNVIIRLAALMLAMGCATIDDVDGTAGEMNKNESLATPFQGSEIDALRTHILEQGVYTPEPGDVRPFNDPLVKLGQILFFDKIVSGNSDVACATCHHPSFGTSDGLPTSIGVGGEGIGPNRLVMGEAPVIPRNSPDLFNRGVALWSTMFWDARVSVIAGYFETPAGTGLPAGLDSILAAQAMFPPTSPHEMRGEPGSNPIADLEGSAHQEIWNGLIARILAFDEYVDLFSEAYPELSTDEIGFQHAANAMAAFEVSAFTRLDTPFDRFLAGQDNQMSNQALRGAQLFYGEAGCSDCHSGPLFTDQKAHSLAAPQLGPGKSDDGYDRGRELETGNPEDAYAFRTPPLRNVSLTGPYLHAGTFATLEDVILHHVQPTQSLESYTGEHLNDVHRALLLVDEAFIEQAGDSVSPKLAGCESLGDEDIQALVAFLEALTDESAKDMSDVIPMNVPSGLSIF
jgi:cytochrome c peroxidase